VQPPIPAPHKSAAVASTLGEKKANSQALPLRVAGFAKFSSDAFCFVEGKAAMLMVRKKE
jgi:hypothetical protein